MSEIWSENPGFVSKKKGIVFVDNRDATEERTEECIPTNFEEARDLIRKLTLERDKAMLLSERNRDEVLLMIDAVKLLTRLANYDPLSDSNMKNTTRNVLTESNDYQTMAKPLQSSHDVNLTLQFLEDMHLESCLRQTPLPSLVESIQRLQSHLAIISTEADMANTQNHALHKKVKSLSRRLERIEIAFYKVHNENADLKLRIKQKDKYHDSMVKGLKKFVEGVKKREQYRDAHIQTMSVDMHERILHNSISIKNKNIVDDNSTGVSSLSMASTLITDHSTPTVRLYQEKVIEEESLLSSKFSKVFKGLGGGRSSSFKRGEDQPKDTKEKNSKQIYHIFFPNRSMIGLKFKKIPVSRGGKWEDGAFSDRINDDLDCSSDDETSKSGLSWKFRKAQVNWGYVVSGFLGRGDETSPRPMFGARLVGVGNVSLQSGQWTPEKIKYLVAENENEALRLSFQNNTLTRKQIQLLQTKGNDISIDITKKEHLSDSRPLLQGFIYVNEADSKKKESKNGLFREFNSSRSIKRNEDSSLLSSTSTKSNLPTKADIPLLRGFS